MVTYRSVVYMATPDVAGRVLLQASDIRTGESVYIIKGVCPSKGPALLPLGLIGAQFLPLPTWVWDCAW